MRKFAAKPIKSNGFWDVKENIIRFLQEIKEKKNLNSFEDWNSITKKQIQTLGGGSLLSKYSMYEIKCMGYPEGKLKFKKSNKPKPIGFWKNENNIIQFLNDLKVKLNLNSFKDWDSITAKQIQLYGGGSLLSKYSLYDLKCLGFPDGKFDFDRKNQYKPQRYWENKDNVLHFLTMLKEKYNLQNSNDWNSITAKQIQLNGGGSLLSKYSLYQLKCMGFPGGKFDERIPSKPPGYWDKEENISNFLVMLQEKYNLQSAEDWNSLSVKNIQSMGGSSLLSKFSLFEIKCKGFPNGNSYFDKEIKSKSTGHWDNEENILNFLQNLKEKYNLRNTKDWNSLTWKQIQTNGGSSLLSKYSLYDLKCLGFPDGKLEFRKPIHTKPSGYWDKEENILQFICELKQNFHLKTIDDWNFLTVKQIQTIGGATLLKKYSLYNLKCLACPEGKSVFEKPIQPKPSGYWSEDENISQFLDTLEEKYNLKTLEDWSRLSRHQIESTGGTGLAKKLSLNKIIQLKHPTITPKYSKRSSQRWLFLQIQKLFPKDEIIEDYYHSELSRETGYSVQFDIFLINRNIAFEYHGQQHYEDTPSNFAPLEMYKHRDEEKEKICKKFGIQLVIIPFWWDNSMESLKEKLTQINVMY